MKVWRRICCVLLVLLAWTVVSSPAWTASVTIDNRGIEDPQVLNVLSSDNNLELLLTALEQQQPRPEDAIRKTIEDQRRRLEKRLEALGYMEARVEIQAVEMAPQLSVRFRPVLGPLWRLSGIKVIGLEDHGLDIALREQIRGYIDQYVGRTADTKTLDEFESQVLNLIRARFNPFARITNLQIKTDRNSLNAVAELTVDTGERAYFGPVRFRGSLPSNPDRLNSFVTFSPGERYDKDKIDALHNALKSSGKFSTIQIELEPMTSDGQVPVVVLLNTNPPDPAKLFQSGIPGLLIGATGLLMVLTRQVLLAGGYAGRSLRWLVSPLTAVLIMGLAFTIVRVLTFFSMIKLD